nr:hypothetical protein Itr_chr12CG11270 [Ipomoea trifida]
MVQSVASTRTSTASSSCGGTSPMRPNVLIRKVNVRRGVAGRHCGWRLWLRWGGRNGMLTSGSLSWHSFGFALVCSLSVISRFIIFMNISQ